jgi:hypothetical protein
MKIDVGIGNNRLPEGLLAQMEPSLKDSRPPSVVSSDSHYDNEDYAGELWDELEVLLRAQEGDFVEQYKTVLTDALFDAPAIPIVKGPSTPMSSILSLQHHSAIPRLVSGPSQSPSVSLLQPSPRPLSPMRSITTNLKGGYQPHVSPPHPHLLLLPQGTSVAGQSARTRLARESPSRRFFASPDQIDALGTPRTWVHSQVISTLGDTFCHASHSKPRCEWYEVLPTNLFNLWDSLVEGHIGSRTCLSFHFKQAMSPSECRAWLIPVLLESHWYLLAFDWEDHDVHIYDSLATDEMPHLRLIKFGDALLHLIAEDFEFNNKDWGIIPEQVSSFHHSSTRF